MNSEKNISLNFELLTKNSVTIEPLFVDMNKFRP